jgi:hypothetical protein
MKTAMQEFVDNNFYIDGDGEYILKWVEDTPLTDEINEALKKEKAQFLDFMEWIEIANIKYPFNNWKIIGQYYKEKINKS